MATLEIIGLASKVLKYTDDNNGKLRIVIAHIIGYTRRGDGYISITTARGEMQLDLNTKAAVTTAIALLDSQF